MTGLPIALGVLGYAYNPLWFFAAITPIFTGMFQVTTAISLFIEKDFRSTTLTIYLIATIVFFALWINTDWDWIWAMPPALALYMSALLFIEAKNEKL